MPSILKWVTRTVLVLVLAVATILRWGPVETVDLAPHFDAAQIGPDLDAWLAQREQAFPDIVPGTAKQVIWAGAPGVKTPLAVVYLHGFSATSAEIRPVPDLVAKALGANLYYTRLTGHGLTGQPAGQALGAALPEDWINDTAEALAVGRRLGDHVLVIATSTGGTLAAIAAVDPTMSQDISGIVLISPNLRMLPIKARLLDMGYADVWAPWLVGSQISFTPLSEGDATYWTNSYPLAALFHAAGLVRAAQTLDMSNAKMPLIVFYSPQDQVVDETRTVSLFKRWGGPVRWEPRQMTDKDDAASHVITGDIRSPEQTASTVTIILDWAKEMGL